MNIPHWPQADEREAELLRMVLESAKWGGFHPFVAEFEQSFAAYQHCAFGISAANGTVTLELAFAALGIGPGDEVIVPAISFISTASTVSRAGATPVFVDVEANSFNVDPECVRAAVTPKTKAVIAVHFGGAMCRIEELSQICRDRDLVLIEDAAHAHGSEWNGKRAGSFGIAGSFSFQNGKVLSSGEGGMLVTSDERFAE
ncbi:MAG: aminotransferase class I/II-fold pyridoxal phosphate-dependent enzyme, partial [Acidobacteriaceae bacterium]|nr:aminotransferase class I/II-fold pyridoxal phosphate-dependent enzyme [Acidobacteriaceae bacterium]